MKPHPACVVLLVSLSSQAACDDRGVARGEGAPARAGLEPAPLRAGPPRLGLGGWSGEGHADFDGIVSAVVDRNAGVLVIANGGDATIRVFGLDGEWRGTQGGLGGGPREFRDLTDLFRYRGDSLVAFDEDADAATVRPYTGEGVRRVSAPPLPSDSLRNPRLRGALADGRLVWSAESPCRELDEVRESHAEPRVILLTSAEGADVVPVAKTTGRRYFRYETGVFQAGGAPFSPHSFVLPLDSVILFGSTERARAERIADTGVSLDPIPFFLSSLAVTDTYREWDIARRRAVLNRRPLPMSLLEGQKAVLDILPFPDSFPVLGKVIAGEDGRVWVTGYRPPETDPTRVAEDHTVWSVYEGPGSRRLDIEFPARFDLFWADETDAVGVVRDEFDIEHVLMVPLPPAAGSREP